MHVEKKDSDGDLLVRDSLVTAFFCQKPYPKLAASFGRVFDEWLASAPADAKRWAIVGPDAEEYKAFTAKLSTRARAELDAARAKTREMCSLELGGPQMINPDWQFSFSGARDIEDDETCFLEIRSPSEEADAKHVEQFVAKVKRIAEQLPFDSGYSSLALTWGADSQRRDFAEAARKWAFRYPGFDMPANVSTSFGIDHKLRGAYWLTFVGPWALEQLGGEGALRKALPKEVGLEKVGAGVMLRTGSVPEVGDVNRGDTLPLLRATAKVLERVTLFDDAFLNKNFVDENERARWERRHLT